MFGLGVDDYVVDCDLSLVVDIRRHFTEVATFVYHKGVVNMRLGRLTFGNDAPVGGVSPFGNDAYSVEGFTSENRSKVTQSSE